VTRRVTAVCALALCALAACERGRGDAARGRPAEVRPTPEPPPRWGVGRPATAAEVAAWDLDVNPRGVGLPPGRGTHRDGATVFASKCAACHGARGEGMGKGSAAVPRLIGRDPRDGFAFGRDLKHVRTIGNYWPYATTVYDYVRRAMPLNAPGSLTPDELYALTAFLLAENEVIAPDAVMDARTLPLVQMPAHGRFVPDDRTGGATFR
jgi:cytochrome c